MSRDPQSQAMLSDLVSKAVRTSTRLPILRKGLQDYRFKSKTEEVVEIVEDQLVVLNVISLPS